MTEGLGGCPSPRRVHRVGTTRRLSRRISNMIRRTWIARLFIVAAATGAAVAMSSGKANAGLLPVSVTVQPEVGNFRWTYSVVLPTDMKLQAGNYFTIYDFAGYQKGSANVSSAN